MQYSIGDIANLLGISLVSVRNYEKCGLLEPERNEKNNYRKYNAIDLNLIRRARFLMSYGFSLSEATQILLHESLPGLAASMKEREAALQKQLFLDYQKLTFIRQHADHLQRISVSEGSCHIEMSPSFYAFSYRHGTQILDDPRLHERVKRWNCSPFAETFLLYSQEDFEKREMIYQSGLCIEERYASALDIEIDSDVRHYPSRRCVYSIATSPFEPSLNKDDFFCAHITDWIEQQRLHIAGDVIGRVLLTGKSTGEWQHHIEFWVPIE